jgi:hypothetical protein
VALEPDSTLKRSTIKSFGSPKDELIVFAVPEFGECSPRLLFWRTIENDASLFKFLIGLFDLRGGKDDGRKGPNPIFLSFHSVQNNPCFCFRDAQLDPSLFFIERLVGDDGETELLCVKIKRAILIAHRDGNEFDVGDHGAKANAAAAARSRREQGVAAKTVVRLSV